MTNNNNYPFKTEMEKVSFNSVISELSMALNRDNITVIAFFLEIPLTPQIQNPPEFLQYLIKEAKLSEKEHNKFCEVLSKCGRNDLSLKLQSVDKIDLKYLEENNLVKFEEDFAKPQPPLTYLNPSMISAQPSPNIDQAFYQEFSMHKSIFLIQLIQVIFSFQKHKYNDQQLEGIEDFVTEFFVKITTASTKTTTAPTPSDLKHLAIGWNDFNHFFKLFGPSNNILDRIYTLSTDGNFHGFIRGAEAKELLAGKPGSFLFRYSESQSEKGYFSFNLNRKKNSTSNDEIQNFSLPYNCNNGMFVFEKKEYASIQKFIEDPKFKNSFMNSVQKQAKLERELKILSLEKPKEIEIPQNVIKTISPNNVHLKFHKADQAIIIKSDEIKEWPPFDTIKFGPLNCEEITQHPAYITVGIPRIRCGPQVAQNIGVPVHLYKDDKPVGNGFPFTYIITNSKEVQEFVRTSSTSGTNSNDQEMINWRDENNRTMLHHVSIMKDQQLIDYLGVIGLDKTLLDMYENPAEFYFNM